MLYDIQKYNTDILGLKTDGVSWLYEKINDCYITLIEKHKYH